MENNNRNVIDILQERGFIKQFTHEAETRELLSKEKITFYIGFDPTADSLHIGHFITLMFMSHMQKSGHRPIALLGGGTAMIGDPSGKADMRTMMTKEMIAHNADCMKKQMEKFIDFSNGKAIMDNNANWLLNLNYVEFIRDIGVHFNVNTMLQAECFKNRMKTGGLTFLEFNYMLMQSYDFLVLNQKYDCIMQLGGDDQWSNMIAGVDLIRKKEKKPAFTITCPLLTNSEGQKMGKTVKGALWLDPKKTTPFEFYQYWRNIGDADVEKCLALLTYLPMDEVRRLGALKDAEINEAKKVLAFEITKLIHGEEEAKKCKDGAEALFSGAGNLENAPKLKIDATDLEKGIVALLAEKKIIPTTSEGRKLIQAGALQIGEHKFMSHDEKIPSEFVGKNDVVLKLSKKKFFVLEF